MVSKKSSEKRDDQKEELSVSALASELAEMMILGLENIKPFVEGLKETDDDDIEDRLGEINRELTMAHLFALTHSLEAVFYDHPKQRQILDELHVRAYAYLGSEYLSFNGPEYEQDLGRRYLEYSKIMITGITGAKSPSTMLFELGESISRHIWGPKYKDKLGFIVGIGTWIGGVIGSEKKFLREIIRQYEIK